VSDRRTATGLAAARVAAARDDPVRRLELAAGTFDCGMRPEGLCRRFARSELE
jgi:hypothetical protein